MTTTIVVPVSSPIVWDPSDPSAPAVAFRTEALKKCAAIVVVDRETLNADMVRDMTMPHIRAMLLAQLDRTIDAGGRMRHGDITFDEDEDVLHDQVRFRATCLTRRSDQGQWPAIWASYDEDAEDRRAAGITGWESA